MNTVLKKPRLLDMFCGEGGAAVGYARAGFEVVGVDLVNKKKRFPYEFHQGDAVEFAREHGHEFDAIHASPPCQHASAGTRALRANGGHYPALIEDTRKALETLGKPWVIENVVGAALREPITLCGTMFGLQAIDDDGTPLRLERHRRFESNVALSPHPRGCQHDKSIPVAGSYGGARRDRWEAKHVRHGGYVPSISVQRRLLGIDWMTQAGMYQSIPPVYATFVGAQMLKAVTPGRLAC